jgi:hypothetical protein
MHRVHRDQRGQSLVIVLSLITILFLLGSALAVHASAALRATRASEGQGNDFYAADAATELGIWWQRNGKAGNPPAQTINGVTTSTTINVSGGGGGSCPAEPRPMWMTGLETGFVALNSVQVGLISGSPNNPLIDWAFGGGDAGVVTSPVRTGNYALRIHPLAYPGTGAYYSIDKNSQTIASTLVMRFSVRLAAIPTGDADIMSFNFNGGNYLALYYKASIGKWAMQFTPALVHTFTGTYAAGPTVTAGTWYNFDLRLIDANPRTAEWQVDGTAYSSVSSSEAATAGFIAWFFGHNNGDNADITMYFDDMMASSRSSDYPLGDVKIAPLLPNGIGTSAGATNFQNNDNSAINATTWQRLDEIPMTGTTDYVKQVAVGTGSQYVEIAFADTTETCIRGASIAAAFHSAGTQGNNAAFNTVANGINVTIASIDPSETSLRYAQGMVSQNTLTPGVGPWTQAVINGTMVRVGMSGDVSPNPYFDALLMEYGYRPQIGGPATVTIIGTGGASTVTTDYTDVGAGVPTLDTWTVTK